MAVVVAFCVWQYGYNIPGDNVRRALDTVDIFRGELKNARDEIGHVIHSKDLEVEHEKRLFYLLLERYSLMIRQFDQDTWPAELVGENLSRWDEMFADRDIGYDQYKKMKVDELADIAYAEVLNAMPPEFNRMSLNS